MLIENCVPLVILRDHASSLKRLCLLVSFPAPHPLARNHPFKRILCRYVECWSLVMEVSATCLLVWYCPLVCFHLALILLDDEFGWVLSNSLLFFWYAADISSGQTYFSIRIEQCTTLPQPSSWLPSCSYFSLHVCDVLYHFPDIFFFSDLLLEKILNFSLCSFFICCFSVSISSSVWCVVVAL